MLGLLDQVGPLNGNALSRSADELIGDFWTLTRSQVYRELHALERSHYVHAGPPGARASREFRITDEGREALSEWLNTASSDEVVRVPLLLMIRFAESLSVERLRTVIEDFAARHRAKAEYYQNIETQLRQARSDPFEMATVRFGQLFERAVSEWLGELPELIPTLAPPSSHDRHVSSLRARERRPR
jgi:DNA-binding PadR family transcriptional regulator